MLCFINGTSDTAPTADPNGEIIAAQRIRNGLHMRAELKNVVMLYKIQISIFLYFTSQVGKTL